MCRCSSCGQSARGPSGPRLSRRAIYKKCSGETLHLFVAYSGGKRDLQKRREERLRELCSLSFRSHSSWFLFSAAPKVIGTALHLSHSVSYQVWVVCWLSSLSKRELPTQDWKVFVLELMPTVGAGTIYGYRAFHSTSSWAVVQNRNGWDQLFDFFFSRFLI